MLPDVFLTADLKKLFNYKTVVLLGDSNMRAIYKDLVWLSQNNSFVSEVALKTKMESSFCDDRLVYSIKKTNARIYKEERVFTSDSIHIEFYFITKVYDEYVDKIMQNMRQKKPDVVLVSSCLWDITRWGPKGVEKYKENLNTIAEMFNKVTPDSLVIWLTTLPISQEMRGGVLVPQLDFLKYSLRYHVMEANQYAQKVFIKNRLDVLDLHYNLQMMIHLRGKDGIHWIPPAVRHQSNLILTHISLAWGVSLPHRFERSGEKFPIENYDLRAEETLNGIQIKEGTKKKANSEVSNDKQTLINHNPHKEVTINKIVTNNSQCSGDNPNLLVCENKEKKKVIPSFIGDVRPSSDSVNRRKKANRRRSGKRDWSNKGNCANLTVTVKFA